MKRGESCLGLCVRLGPVLEEGGGNVQLVLLGRDVERSVPVFRGGVRRGVLKAVFGILKYISRFLLKEMQCLGISIGFLEIGTFLQI